MYIEKRTLPSYLQRSEKQIEDLIDGIARSMRGYFDNSGYGRAVVGLSGGIDSAVSMALSVKSLEARNVVAVRLPFRRLNDQGMAVAAEVAEAVGLPSENLLTVDITAAVENLWCRAHGVCPPESPEENDRRLGNAAARIRMAFLMDIATARQALLVGTENRTERKMGYFTIGGDAVSNIEPLGRLYKSEVYQLGKCLNLPESVLTRPPSAELWPGQTDEREMGFPYVDADSILAGIDAGMSCEEIRKAPFSRDRLLSPQIFEAVIKRLKLMAPKAMAPFVVPR